MMPDRTLKATPGDGSRRGATVHDDGVNFAVVSGVADEVTLCLFDAGTGAETQVTLNDYDAGVWHGFVPGIETGQRYGYRVTGPFDPSSGVRCNPNKLLLDPYARAFAGKITWGTELLGHDPDNPSKPSPLDSKDHISRSVVTDTSYDWGDDVKPGTSYADTIVYEAHAKGSPRRIPVSRRTFAAPTPAWRTRRRSTT
jgi:isoamylase